MTTAVRTKGLDRPSGRLEQWFDRVRSIVEAPGPSPTVQRLVLAATVLVCAVVRLLTIGRPPLADTAWKEIDYIQLSENYRNGAPFIYPTLTWPAEAPRYTEMEFPVVPYLAGRLELLLGPGPLAVRLLTLIAFLGVVVYVSLIARRELGAWVGMVAAVAAAIIPLLHPFGRLLLSDPMTLAFALATMHHLSRWLDTGRRGQAVAFTILLSLAIALKIEVVFYLSIPLLLLVWRSGRRGISGWRAPVAMAFAALVLPVIWYAWAAHLEATGVHAFGLFRGHDKFQTLTELTSLLWWRTMAGRLVGMLLGGVAGFAITALGLIVAVGLLRRAPGAVSDTVRAGITLWASYAAGVVAYVIIVAEGHLDAPYRQLVAVPILAVLVALGALGLVAAVQLAVASVRRGEGGMPVLPAVAAAAAVVVVGLAGPNLTMIKDGPAPDDSRSAYAATIAAHARPGDEVAVLGEYDLKKGGNDISPVLFYKTGLHGWNFRSPEDCSAARVEELIGHGATLFAVVPPYGHTDLPNCGDDPAQQAAILARHPVLVDDGQVLLVDLRATKS